MNTFTSRISLGRLLLFAIAVILASLAALLVLTQTVSPQDVGIWPSDCALDRYNALNDPDADKLNCSSSDVGLGSFELVTGPATCQPGEEITVVLKGLFESTAGERYDVAFFVATDGGDAHTGVCYNDFLHPVSATNGDVDVTSGVGPYFNAELTDDPDDVCGDIQDKVENLFDTAEVTIICQDSDGDSVADVSTVTVWANSKSDGTANKPSCTGAADTSAENKSKCTSASVPISGLLVPYVGYLEVVKDLEPPDDGGLFNLQIDGTDVVTDVGDARTTGVMTVTAGTSLDPGDTHSVNETPGTGTNPDDYLSSILCINRDTGAEVASGPGPLSFDVQPNDDILCTASNQRKQGSILFEKVVNGGTAQPSDWQFTADNQTVNHGESLYLYLGNYEVTETGGSENDVVYELVDASGACSLVDGKIIVTVTEAGGTCTVTNERRTGTILFQKEIEADVNGASPSDWSFTVDGQTVAHGASLELDTGTYAVIEDGGATNNANYKLTGASGACSPVNGEIVLTVTEEGGTCTVSNARKMGSLDVIKVVEDTTLWTLSYSGPAEKSEDLGNGEHLGPEVVPSGTFTVTEAPAEGTDGSLYASTGFCEGATDNGILSPDGRTITGVVIDDEDEVECTFTNSKTTGQIAILKETDPPGLEGTFDFTSNTTPAEFSLEPGQDQKFLELPSSGVYTFAETVPEGWDVKGIACTGQDESQVTYEEVSVGIVLAPREEISCTFTNDPLPTIDVVKTANPAYVYEPGDWVTYTVQVINNGAAVEPVTLTKLEDDLYGDLTDAGNTQISDSTCELVPLDPGESVTCSFTAMVSGTPGIEVTDVVTVTAEDQEEHEVRDQDDAVVKIVAVPPDTGVALPASAIVSVLSALGAVLLGAGLFVRWRLQQGG